MSEKLKIVASTVAKLRALLSETRKDLNAIETLHNILLESLENLWEDLDVLIQSQQSWKETLSLVGTGRVLSVSAQAAASLDGNSNSVRNKLWISDGSQYSRWLGKGVTKLLEQTTDKKAAAQLCAKAISLGYADIVVEQILDTLILSKNTPSDQLVTLLHLLSRYDQKQFMSSTIRLLSSKYLLDRIPSPEGPNTLNGSKDLQRVISGSAALLKNIMVQGTSIEHELCEWLVVNPCSNKLARVIIVTLSRKAIWAVLDKSWEQFGDKLRIKHTPVIQQESTAQILLMLAGHLHRSDPKEISIRARSSTHTSAISERLGSSSPQIRFLGMIVGMSISQLVDQPETQLKFGDTSLTSPEGIWYRHLIEIHDEIGSVNDLMASRQEEKVVPHRLSSNPKLERAKHLEPAKPLVVEILEDADPGLDSSFQPFEKADSDFGEDDEDPTIVNRNKPKAPVYIRDLITSLKNTENYDQHKLALRAATTLIRQKINFGSELNDRLEELSLTLVGLGDPFELDQWDHMRQQAMVATIVAKPRQMGPWYARAFFNGDYSISQRASILVALGLSARDLGGHQKEPSLPEALASKRLPENLHKLYSQTSDVDKISRKLEQTMLNSTTITKQRTGKIRSDLIELIAESLFFPLTGYWQMSGQSRHTRSIFVDPFLLPLFLKTIAIITSSAGGSSFLLPQMTSEFWQLLLSLRSQALNDSAILEAELFSLLTILNVNDDSRRLALEHSTELLETQEWTGMVFEKLSDADEESERCKVLAAGILVAIKQIVDNHHRLMVGDLIRM